MSVAKKLLSYSVVQSAICRLVYIYIRFVFLTNRHQTIGYDHVETLINDKKPFIVAFWHGRILMVTHMAPKGLPVHVLISPHRDGELIAKVVKYFGFLFVRGSSNKKSISALKQCVSLLQDGDVLAITPDGPRGPRMHISGNIVAIASKSNVPIVPVSFSSSRCKIFKSWDRFILSLPFGSSFFLIGEPYYVDELDDNRNIDYHNQRLEHILNRLTEQADHLAGVSPVKPQKV